MWQQGWTLSYMVVPEKVPSDHAIPSLLRPYLVPCGVPNMMLTVQERWTWCCWVMTMAKGDPPLLTSSRACVSDISVLRKIRSTTMPRSRTFRPTDSAYSLAQSKASSLTNQSHTGTETLALHPLHISDSLFWLLAQLHDVYQDSTKAIPL